ncbi:apolipoprotein N-acyltransferase [Alienimonas chondri]|uniref:Apolipoprotein N-acyltransferase n=1 Tax=Alienimonas chondri TaxID=2681879 RepID=A0ABX1VFX0_9PLAN|nr:apolipoprotein N-acyltransferase [Alienimonas chondri]NNJ26162.1 Apolipoprotein N-acyltransferase [Alienimonas chondri]
MPVSAPQVVDRPIVVTPPTDPVPSDSTPSATAQPTERLTPGPLTTREPTVRAILRDAARTAPVRPPARTAWLCGALSAALLWACFYPLAWAPLAWAALIPLCLLVRSPVRTKWEVRALWACGFVGTACQIQWMRLGDPAMYPAWLALSLYLGLYFPAFVLACRGLVHRANVPFAVAVPVAWCGLELIRGRLMTGFGWNLLAHSQWDWTTLIQVADLGGAYLVGAVVALGNAALALLIPAAVLNRLGLNRDGYQPGAQATAVGTADGTASQAHQSADARPKLALRAGKAGAPSFAPLWPAVGTACVLGGVLLYGTVRRAGDAFPAGPRVALVQTDHSSSLQSDLGESDARFTSIRLLSGAATPYRPDLVVWPESAFPYPLLSAKADVSEEAFAAAAAPIAPPDYFRSNAGGVALASLAETAGAYLLAGATAGEIADPDGDGPLPARFTRYGSAAMAAPTGGVGADGLARGAVMGRYDKRHRVVFGEYIPNLPGLASLTPFTEQPGQQIGIGEGAAAVAFRIEAVGSDPKDGEARKSYTVAPLICYEDTVPHLVRDTVNALPTNGAGKETGPDVLAVLSNDGWFDNSAEQEQHLAVSLFRAIETRTPVVRAANTGVSAVIDGDGVPREPAVYLNEQGESVDVATLPNAALPDDEACVLIADVPLDPRRSLYLQIGDAFAFLCGLAACIGFALNLRRRPVIAAAA